MYYTYIRNTFEELNNEIEYIKKEIEEYFNKIYGENINLNYDIIEVFDNKFFACVDNDNKVKFDLEFVNKGYVYLFNIISSINPENSMILKDIIKILLNCLLVHESHHFYYKIYRSEEYIKIKNKDAEKTHRKDKELEVLADNFMVDFMKEKGDLHYMIAKLLEKVNQMKNDDYTRDDRIDDIFNKVKNIYT